jgi:hypothetical protein
LANVTFQGTTPPLLGGANVFTDTHSTLKIFVPVGRAETYRAVTQLSAWRNRIHRIGCQYENPAPGSDCGC